ncbi:nucleoid-associated protein [Paenibacillus apiarius]|uniref:Nucleoid-associated protein n=1 Tax=Paenibacillus apiarius TaxID=46240 RepID=A0ABT4DR21_9BACL|nr:nucleoid-associated protein [Paenibacillus apiarius]MCY9512534.1 nucleoid-associated protein [Paenibacillus apiarius]MCY9519805.1 nucleoid-associated protein [Paenibacillus apiarius]MCY9553122.1 nucleoid-associated protein [Paenibacillus apiarius]MCY9559310.1 nucleoid-associated protein [Paenibacillus apiarius]MCY9682669.1 nucleoid-associated protein [Paenibacillus apiarius]
MIDLSKAEIHRMIVHRVGSPSQDEGVRISQTLYDVPNEDVRDTLLKYFLSSFKFDATYRFQHESELSLNEVYTYAGRIFQKADAFQEQSVHILNHLYAVSGHPQIKPGELYVVHLNNILYNNFSIDALGIFKSENKDVFLQVDEPQEERLGVRVEEGVNVRKLDKGCLILNVQAEAGYSVGVVDTSSGKQGEAALFWLEDFLNVKLLEDEHYLTDKVIEMCTQFYDDVIAPAAEERPEKKEKLQFINSTIDYFAKHEQFEEEAFTEEVIAHPDIAPIFKTYKETYEEANELPPLDEIPISQVALKRAKRTFKNNIRTDTGVELKLKSESFPYVEKGYDENRGMHYYKVFYNEEE